MSKSSMKNFLGEKAFKYIENSAYDPDAIRVALVTPQNARAVFSDLTEFQAKSLISNICDSGTIGKVIHATQEEIKNKFAEAGYGTVIFDDKQEIDNCQKYYATGERICTYNNLSGRMREYHMIVAIKDNIDGIQRSRNPKREDEYGTSIINIQIAKNGSHMSIKNRYNHTVMECDATFGNDLNNISPGLHGMVLGYYGFAELKNKDIAYYPNVANIGKVYLKYHVERNNIYFGEFVLDGDNGVRYADPGLYYVTRGKDCDYWYCPLVLDFHNKIAIDLLKGNTKSMLITRAMREGFIHSGNKDQIEKIKLKFENATKELLKTNRKALKYAYEKLGYDFQKPYKVTGILGSFTAKSIEKIIGSKQALLLCLDGSSLRPVIMADGFYALDKRIDYEYGINNFHRQSDFEKYRKSSGAACYVIWQDRKYHKKVKVRDGRYGWQNVIDPKAELKARLLEYKAKKRMEEASAIDYMKTAEEIESKFLEMKNKLVQSLVSANYPEDYARVSDVVGYNRLKYLVSAIGRFKESAKNKTFSSIKSAQKDIESLTVDINKIIEILNK